MTGLPPRIVIVTRESDFELLLARHATREAARFQLESRGDSIDRVEARHLVLRQAVQTVRAGLPRSWRQTAVRRADLDRFLFQPEDIVVAVGQDGLVANVAKYLRGQPVVGVNPDPASAGGALARIVPAEAALVLAAASAGRATIEARSMVEARLDSGETLVALNEIFVGHKSHQSAIYDIAHGPQTEHHSSSGLIVASGTGVTGWAKSILAATARSATLDPCASQALFLVREAWPSPATDANLVVGKVDAHVPLQLVSRMDGGVIFADGIERDYLRFDWGQRLTVRPADRTLSLVVGAG